MNNSFDKFKQSNASCNNVYQIDYHSKLINLNLFLTDSCNLKCKYCFVNHSNHYMSLDIAEKAIEWGLQHTKKDTKLTVSFFGGEPLLLFYEVIKPIVLKYKDRLLYNITTNGTLLTEEICMFLKEHNFNILYSYDGNKKVSNYQRDNSFNDATKNLNTLLKYYPNLKVRVTLTKYSLKHLYNSIMHILSLGVKFIDINPNIYEKWNWIDKKIFEYQSKRIITFLSKNNLITINPFSSLLNQFFTKQIFNNHWLHCGLGTSNCSIDYLGRIFPCQEYVTLADNQNYILGDIFTGINNINHQLFLEKYTQQLQKFNCKKKCHYITQQVCQSQICPSKLFTVNFIRTKTECIYYTALMKVILNYFNLT